MARVPSHRRRGSMYVMVVGCAAMTAAIGIAALMALRIERRAAEGASGMAEARVYAQSAIEIGLYAIGSNQNWRTSRPNGAWLTDRPIGAGTYSISVEDTKDGDLSDAEGDSVVMTGTGKKGPARQVLQVTLKPEIIPIEALSACLHAGGTVTTQVGTTVTVSGAPLSCNGTVQNNGTIVGDVEAAVLAGSGSVSGTATVPAPSKPMPDAGVLSLYISRATVIPFTGDIDRQVLGPTLNPWGQPNAEGVYYLDAGSNDIDVKRSRIHGTLIIKCGSGKKVVLDDTVFMHSFRSDYPVLMVDGDLHFNIKSTSYDVVESSIGVNLNPAGAPYLGVTDSDQSDTYPNEVQGLVHVKGAITLKDSSKVKGVVICESTVTWEASSANSNFTYDPTLFQNPPEGYFSYGSMEIESGSWRQIVD